MRRSGKDWLKNEQEVMKLLGLEQVPGSGSSWLAREDGSTEDVLCQLKSTDASSIRIQKQDVDELLVNATIEHKLPVFAIQFRESNEVYLVVRPLDLPDLAKYIKSGKTLHKPSDVQQTVSDDFKKQSKSKRVIKSSKSARDKFSCMNSKKYEKKGKSAR